MNANSISLPPPELEDRCLDLLIATIEHAHRDIKRPSTPEEIRTEAQEFIQWATETIDEDPPAFFRDRRVRLNPVRSFYNV